MCAVAGAGIKKKGVDPLVRLSSGDELIWALSPFLVSHCQTAGHSFPPTSQLHHGERARQKRGVALGIR